MTHLTIIEVSSCGQRVIATADPCEHQWKQVSEDEVGCMSCGAQPGDLTEAIDDLHMDCVEARYAVRREFTTARLLAAAWQPAPCPPHSVFERPAYEHDEHSVPYLDEVDVPRAWFRS